MNPRRGRALIAIALLLGAVLVVWIRSWTSATDAQPISVSQAQAPARTSGERRVASPAPVALAGLPTPTWEAPPEQLGDAALEGVVLAPDGSPVAGCPVLVSTPQETLREQSGPEGRFSLIVPTREELQVTADCGEGASAPASLRLEKDSFLALHLAPRRVLRVMVVSERTEAPVANATVALLRGHLQAVVALTDERGVATLQTAAFVDRLRVMAKGHAPQEQPTRGAGEARADAPPLVVRLTPAAALTVSVASEQGTPVPGATIRLKPVRAVQSQELVATADAQGMFVWDSLPRGTFEVEAWHGEHGLGRAPTLSWNGLQPESVLVRLGGGAAIAGRVLDSAGASVPEAHVILTRHVAFGSGAEFVFRADRSGRFRVPGAGAGSYLVHARNGALTSSPVRVRGGDEGVELTLLDSGRIEGRVITRNGRTIPGAVISARSLEGTADPRTTRTDEKGLFQLDGLGGGRFEVTASRVAGAARAKKTVAVGEQVVLELPDDGILRGRVRTEDGQPVSSLSVSIAGYGERIADVRENGVFRVAGVPPGNVLVEVRAPGYAAPPLRSATLSEGRETDLGELLLSRGRALEGTVVDEHGAPVAGAAVHVGSRLIGDALSLVTEDAAVLGQIATARTGPEGRFRIDDAPAQARWLMAEHVTAGRSSPLALTAGAPLVKLRITGRLVGRVMLGGAPAAGLLIIVNLDSQRDVQFTALTDADGTYRIEAVPPGQHLLTANLFHAGSFSNRASRSVKVGPGQTVTTDLSISLGEGALHVRYRDAADPARKRPRVSLSGPVVDSRFVPDSGLVTFSNLAPGSYNVCLVLPPDAPRCSRVRVSEGAEEIVF